MRKMRVYIYIRVSTMEQIDGYSLGEQEEHLRDYCKAMGWHIVEVFIDGGYSGGNLERPAMEQMRKGIENGQADIVLVDKLDRLSRSQFDTLFLIKKVFEPNNVALVSRTEAFDTSTTMGKAMIGFMSIFAELERDRIKERTSEGREGRAKEGKFRGGGKLPIGYDYNQETGLLEVNEYEAMQLREVFRMFNNREPVYQIMLAMNNAGYRTKYGEWQEMTIRKCVANPLYIGKIKHKSKMYDGIHDPLVTQEVFDRAQFILAERDIKYARYKQGRAYNAPLSGLLFCANCGARYHYRIKQNKGRQWTYYVCYSRAKCDKKMVKDVNCKNTNYRTDTLEEAVYAEVSKLNDSGYFKQLQNSADDGSKIHIIEKRIENINKQIANYSKLFALDNMDIEQLQAQIDPLNEERMQLKNEIEQIQEGIKKKSEAETKDLLKIFDDAIQENDTLKINQLLTELIDFIEIDKETIRIHWNF